MNQRTKIVIVMVASVTVIALLASWLLLKKFGFRAESDPPKAEVFVHVVEENGVSYNEPSYGNLLIDGDCPEEELDGSDGSYYCELIATEDGATNLKLSSLSFFSFISDTTYQIPLSTSLAYEPEDFILAPNEKLSLEVAIDAEGIVSVTRINEETSEYEPFPPPTP